MKRKISLFCIFAILLTAFIGCTNSDGNSSSSSAGKDITIGIGYQSVTAQTWGALVMKNKGFLEDELKKEYPDSNIKIDWQNAQSGPPLTNNMIAGKLQFAFMGDMPILTNGEKGETEQNYKSVFIAFDGKGKDGMNQDILVPNNSDVKSIKDLVGKSVATPIGGSAHRMLLAELDQNGIKDQVKIENQDATVGLTNIQQNKIDAFSIWEPFGTLAEKEGYGRILVGGEDTKIDYLDGVVADRSWVDKNEGYTECFLKALIKTHDFIAKNPDEAAKIFAKESGYSEEVCAEIVKNVRFDSVIYDKDKKTLQGSKEFLQQIGSIKDVDLDKFIDNSYLKKAFEDSDKEYPSDEKLKGDWLPLE